MAELSTLSGGRRPAKRRKFERGGSPGHVLELERLLRRLEEWERPDNEAPVAVLYRSLLERRTTPPVYCRKCLGDTGAIRHTAGCPNVSPRAQDARAYRAARAG